MYDPKIVENVLLILFLRFSFMRDVRNCSYLIPSNSMYIGNSMYYIAKKTALRRRLLDPPIFNPNRSAVAMSGLLLPDYKCHVMHQ